MTSLTKIHLKYISKYILKYEYMSIVRFPP